MLAYSAGWREALSHLPPHPHVARLLPATIDCVREAEFFGTLAADVVPTPDHAAHVNWYMSAFASALSGVRDACKTDFKRSGRIAEFEQSPLAQEFFLAHDDPDPLPRDPMASNRAFWDLRNLRVHHAVPIVELHSHILEEDIAENPRAPTGAPRWYLRSIRADEIRLLQNPKLTDGAVETFNGYVARHPLAVVVFHHLYVLSNAIHSSAGGLAV